MGKKVVKSITQDIIKMAWWWSLQEEKKKQTQTLKSKACSPSALKCI